jgi:hypothetical protein
MKLTPAEKVAALRELTRGPDDVFAMRADHLWRPVYAPLNDDNLRMHLAGHLEVGSYPLIPTSDWPTCYWVGADGKRGDDDSLWRNDVSRLMEFLNDLDEGCPVLVNLSRSARGAHVRMLFREPVPAWMARRWMYHWLNEADVLRNEDDAWSSPQPQTFDRLIPPQDQLSGDVNRNGNRLPGNLMGSPLHGGLARRHGGTLPLDPQKVEQGNYLPDGGHWGHVMGALERRGWGEAELREAMVEWDLSLDAPHYGAHWGNGHRSLPLLPAGAGALDYTLKFCAFMQRMAEGDQSYSLWLALASQLHRFGEDGREAFHALSAVDPRYNPRDTEQKWLQTSRMSPVRCDTLVSMGWRCPHLRMPRCNGTRSPSMFFDCTDAEVL